MANLKYLITTAYRDSRKDRGKLALFMSAGGEFWNGKFNTYYFGVREHEVLTNRPFYDPKSSWNTFYTLNPVFKLGKKWSLTLSGSFKKLGGQVADSPTINSDTQLSGFIGFMYKIY